MIVCDDLNDYVSPLAGHPQAKTPNIAKLARSGVVFKRAYSNNPICAPSRSSFLTGIYPHTSKNEGSLPLFVYHTFSGRAKSPVIFTGNRHTPVPSRFVK